MSVNLWIARSIMIANDLVRNGFSVITEYSKPKLIGTSEEASEVKVRKIALISLHFLRKCSISKWKQNGGGNKGFRALLSKA